MVDTVAPQAIDYRSTSVRPGWDLLTAAVRAAIIGRIGSVVDVSVAGGGFTPAFAATVTTEDGSRWFIKAADLDTEFGRANQREAAVLAALPTGMPVPRLWWAHVVDGWSMLCLEAVDGHMPGQPWTTVELDLALQAQTVIAERLAQPTAALATVTAGQSFAEYAEAYLTTWRHASGHGLALPEEFGWATPHLDRLAALEESVPAATQSTGIVHFDLRADNMIVAGGRVMVVDWNWARPGAAFTDTVLLLQTAHGQHDIDRLLADHPTTAGLAADAVDGVLAAFGGYMILAGQRGPVESSPWLRTHQYAQGARCMRWLADRRGWSIS